jgi:rubredoxin
MDERRCPDCDVPMAEVEFGVGTEVNPRIMTADDREGIRGKLGLFQPTPVHTLACPECGLLRQYVDPDF